MDDFEKLVLENQRLVFQIAYSVLRNAADAEDVAQEVFLRAYRKLDGLRTPESFRPWVARMSWRLALNHGRSAGRALRRDTAWWESAPPESRGAEENMLALRREIGRLPEKLRAALLLSVIEGLDTRGIAAILEILEGTVRSRLHLARKQLLLALFP